MKVFLRSLALICLILTSLGVSHAMGQFFMENPIIGQVAPDFTLKSYKGQEFSLNGLRDNKPSIVFFWATWCPHCREQLKELSAEAPQLQAQGINVILVDLGESAGMVGSYLERNKIGYDVLLDEDSAVAEQYHLLGVPTFIFIRKDGLITAIEHILHENYLDILSGQVPKE